MPTTTENSILLTQSLSLTEGFNERLISRRRYVHQHPELSFAEYATSAWVEAELRAMGVIQVCAPTPTSRVAEIKGTGQGGPAKTIAIRADMDALPIEEQTRLPFASTVPGISHACGHDGHIAILLGVTEILQAHREAFSGTVRLIFQHAEEKAPGGAIELVEKGVMQGVDALLGLHIMPGPVGSIQVSTGPTSSSATDCAWITVMGCGAHASMPETGIDPILIGAEIVTALHTIVSRTVDPDHFAVVSPTVFQGGDVINAIPQSVRIGVNTRTRFPEDRELVRTRIEALAQGIATAHNASASIEWLMGCPAAPQDPALARRALALAEKLLPPGFAITGNGMKASEDFARLAQVAPALHVILGGGTAAEGYPHSNHHPAYQFDERCLTVGAQFQAALALDLLTRG